MTDLSTLTRLYTELCTLWRVRHTPEEYKRAADLFLAHGRHLQATLSQLDKKHMGSQIREWMKTAPRLRSDATCVKIPYTSRIEAARTAKAVQNAHGGRQQPYACKRCGLWHLTSTTHRQFKKNVAQAIMDRQRSQDQGSAMDAL